MLPSCLICRREVREDAESRPFCSTRCKNIDLGRWLGEEYRVSPPMTSGELESTLAAAEGAEQRAAPLDDPLIE